MKEFFGKIRKALQILCARIMFRSAKLGSRTSASPSITLKNAKYMIIGDHCYFGPNCRIEAWDHYNDKTYHPIIIFGNNVKINSTCHIGAINHVEIGDDCLLGSHVMIIDHSHGKNSIDEAYIHPSNRDLFSKGEVIIGPRCWLCENVVILPNVHIGGNCTIAANAVVTHDIPAYSIAAGNPAKVVRKIE